MIRYPELQMSGVYVFRNLETGLCKIGYSHDIRTRLFQLQSNYNLRLSPVYAIPCEHHYLALQRLEREMHQRYASKRVKYEWFALTDDDIAELRDFAAQDGE